MGTVWIHNARIINEGRSFRGCVGIEGERIAAVCGGGLPPFVASADGVLDAGGRWLLPGVIDDQVHFREPGLTHKGCIASESRAAVAGGVTSFMDMPNTVPQTTDMEQWEWKMERAAGTSAANYSFFFGGTDGNAGELWRLDRRRLPGLKVFLGSSTGGMLVDRRESLERIFGGTDLLIAVHAEEESIVRRNAAYYAGLYGGDPDVCFHPLIRSAEACYASSAGAVEMAVRLGARLHLLHLSTAAELSLLEGGKVLGEKRVTGEVCVHHLWFCDADYAALGSRIKWNPAIKTAADRQALREAVDGNVVDVVATDHAPHLLSEKVGGCFGAASGGPMVQHSLVAMLEMASAGVLSSPEKVVEVLCHRPAELFRIDGRGFIRPGYYADLVLVDPCSEWTVSRDNVLYRCGWSPFEGVTFRHRVWKTFVNGRLAYTDGGVVEGVRGMAIAYNP